MMEWKPVSDVGGLRFDEDGMSEDVLVWVANGGMRREGIWRPGHFIKSKHGVRARAEGFMGDFNITHWMRPPPPGEPS